MKLIRNPDIKFPDAFDVYDPKVINNFKTSSAGLTGNKSVEFMFIPVIPDLMKFLRWKYLILIRDKIRIKLENTCL